MCGGQNPGPARIVNTYVGNRLAGAYESCSLAPEYYDDKAPRFFMNHPNLKWVSTASLSAASVPGVINVGPFNIQVARITLNIGNGTFTQIGKVYAGAIYYFVPGTFAEVATYVNIDVLTCSP